MFYISDILFYLFIIYNCYLSWKEGQYVNTMNFRNLLWRYQNYTLRQNYILRPVHIGSMIKHYGNWWMHYEISATQWQTWFRGSIHTEWYDDTLPSILNMAACNTPWWSYGAKISPVWTGPNIQEGDATTARPFHLRSFLVRSVWSVTEYMKQFGW